LPRRALLPKINAMVTRLKRWLKIVVGEILVLLLLVFSAAAIVLASRPPRTNAEEKLFRGIIYLRLARSNPRPLMIHVVEIDLTAPGIGTLVTPSTGNCELEICAMTTGAFLEKYRLQVAINGSFFEPFYSKDYTFSDYYPHTNDPVNIEGLAISNGILSSADNGHYAKLCFTQMSAKITQGTCPLGTTQALAGNEILVADGLVVDHTHSYSDVNPRTAVAVSRDGKKLWLIVIDGRQEGYSEGVTLNELARFAKELGAATALNLDGGGSTTLVASRYGTLNSPIHTRIPMRQRPVANHLGIFALPLDQP
jgi:hypothetical protein